MNAMITPNGTSVALAAMDNSRATRRHRNHEESEFSNQSIMHAMEAFVSTVQEMDDTILVPCRLLDRKVGDAEDSTPVPGLVNGDLYALYTMVKGAKSDLLWGHDSASQLEDMSKPLSSLDGVSSLGASLPALKGHSRTASASNITSVSNINNVSHIKPSHVRNPSTGSLVSAHSVASMSLSDTDSEAGNENDSGIEEGSLVEPSLQIAQNFRRHLSGLHKTLNELTAAASYLTQRYQHDVNSAA